MRRDLPAVQRRKSAPAVVWLMLIAMAGVVVLSIVLAVWVRERGGQVRDLQAQVDGLRQEREALEGRLDELQGTAAALEGRVQTLEANDPAKQLAELQKAVESAGDAQEAAQLRAAVAGIQARVAGFQTGLDELEAKIDAMTGIQDGDLPDQVRLTVPRQKQSHNLSCESSAASMAAQYHGAEVSEAEVLAALPRSANPYLGFRGNVDGPTGGIEDYGVYAGPIADALNRLAPGVQAWPVSGGVDGIKAAVARGNPVIAWVTYNCLASTPVTQIIDGEKVTLVPNQHVVVVTGYDGQGVWANDPWDGQEDYYTWAEFAQGMAYFGDMAVEVAGR